MLAAGRASILGRFRQRSALAVERLAILLATSMPTVIGVNKERHGIKSFAPTMASHARPKTRACTASTCTAIARADGIAVEAESGEDNARALDQTSAGNTKPITTRNGSVRSTYANLRVALAA